MSRTYAHRPTWVHFTDPSVCYPLHDHRTGPCDLPPLEVWFARLRADGWAATWRASSCAWDVDLHAVPRGCGCAMCTGRHDRRAERRRDRARTRRELRAFTTDR